MRVREITSSELESILDCEKGGFRARATRFLTQVKAEWDEEKLRLDSEEELYKGWIEFTCALTRLIGKDNLEWDRSKYVTIDLPSTGGVGNKTPIVVPFLALTELPENFVIPKISSRGASGGTIDILESVGFKPEMYQEEFGKTLKENRICVLAQTEQLARLDKMLMHLRKKTATMRVAPLVVSSILGKKLAVGCDSVVIDIKAGPDSKFGGLQETKAAAKLFEEVWKQVEGISGRSSKISCIVTNNYLPQGACFGRLLSLWEASLVLSCGWDKYDCLRGATRRLHRLSLNLAGKLQDVGQGVPYARPLKDGEIRKPFDMFCQTMDRQGVGNKYLRTLRNIKWDHSQGYRESLKDLIVTKEAIENIVIRKSEVISPCDGVIAIVNMDIIDRVLSFLTEGENKYVGGIRLLADVGEEVCRQQPIAETYSTSFALAYRAAALLQSAAFIVTATQEEADSKRGKYVSFYDYDIRGLSKPEDEDVVNEDVKTLFTKTVLSDIRA